MIDGIPAVKTGRFKPRSYNGDYMKFGDIGVKVCIDWLKDHPDVIGLKDLEKSADYQIAESDITVKLRDGNNPLVEIKTDRYLGKTGKVLVEALRLNHTAPTEGAAALGWSFRSQAKWIFYYAPYYAYVYQFRTDELIRCIQLYTKIAREKAEWGFIPTDDIKSTLVLFLPFHVCRNIVRVHDVLKYTGKFRPNIEQNRLDFGPEPLSR